MTTRLHCGDFGAFSSFSSFAVKARHLEQNRSVDRFNRLLFPPPRTSRSPFYECQNHRLPHTTVTDVSNSSSRPLMSISYHRRTEGAPRTPLERVNSVIICSHRGGPAVSTRLSNVICHPPSPRPPVI